MTIRPTILFHPEAYSTNVAKLMGRNAAGDSFFRGLLKHSCAEEFWALVSNSQDSEAFIRRVRDSDRNEPIKVVDDESLVAMRESGLLYLPGPNLGQYAWQRANFGHRSWSLCGITHTTCSANAMDAISGLLTAPVHPWDALICTSNAVKAHVENVINKQSEYLTERLGATQIVLPQLPIIPLGIHVQDFKFTEVQRAKARQSLNLNEEDVVVLFTGRLSFHAKAHPLAMYQALEQASAQVTGKLVLIECGAYATEGIEQAFNEARQSVCSNVRTIYLHGRKAGNSELAWAAADIFCSFSDNIQEAFGLTPIEAMAAGLPVVVSDWDGYKDTIVDGEVGYRIPTVQPAENYGGDLAYRHAVGIDSYDRHCAYTSALVSVDIDKATQAFIELANSKEKRREMGEKGKQRARHVYDWSVIVPQYEALWQELADLRFERLDNPPQIWPARLDPFYAFSHYPSMTLNSQTLLSLRDEQAVEFLNLAMLKSVDYIIPSKAELNIVLEQAKQGLQTAISLVQHVAPERRAHVLRSLTLLVKIGVFRVHEMP